MAEKIALKELKGKIIIALDVKNQAEAQKILESLPEARIFKVGLELFTAEGPAMIETVKNYGRQVFLDLKLHDIPNTVASAVRAAVRRGVSMLTIHTSGGKEMMRRAVQAAEEEAEKEGTEPPLLLGVTVLTSLKDKDLEETGVISETQVQVLRLAGLALDSGLKGIVCSPQEIELVRRELGPDLKIITPGIRPVWAEAQDQKRIMTPAEALIKGADYMVIGRPITQAASPAEAFTRIAGELEAAV